MDIIKLLVFAVKSFSSGLIGILIDPSMWPFLFLFIYILISQYKKVISMQEEIYGGKAKNSLRDLTSTSILFGLITGVIGSIVTTVTGLTFGNTGGLYFVIVLSLLLMMIKPRYLCLSYSGGLLSLIILVVNSLYGRGYEGNGIVKFIHSNINFDVSALMAMVAVLHLVEALLMWFDGSTGATPVFMEKDGKLQGAFIMQRFWFMPVLIYIYMKGSAAGADIVATPAWWPVFKPAISQNLLKDAIFAASPLLVMLGYSDFAVTTDVKSKVKRSSIGLLIFSILLLLLSYFSTKYYILKYVAVIFAPLAHEGLILYERYRENNGVPIFSFKEDGIIVVDTVPDSPAAKMGIRPGDTIVGINNNPVKNLEDAEEVLKTYLTYLWIDLLDREGNKRTVQHWDVNNGITSLGIITVPKSGFGVPYVKEKEGILENKINKLFNKK